MSETRGATAVSGTEAVSASSLYGIPSFTASVNGATNNMVAMIIGIR